MNIKHQMNRALNFAKWLVLPGDYRDEKPDSIINIRKRKTRYVMLAGFVLFIVLFMATLFLSESEINTPISNQQLIDDLKSIDGVSLFNLGVDNLK